MTEPQNWLVELDGEGGVPRLPGDEEGVLRTGWGDTVQFVLPAGSLPLLKGQPELVVLDELGTQACINNMPPTGPIGDWKAQWHPAKPGPYELFVRAAGFEGPRCRIVVDPLMTLNGKPLPARSVVQLTVLSRCAGAIERWPEALAPQGALGYNMVHFTPIQPPGESGSCYALDDQNAVDPTLLEAPAATHEARLQQVKASVDRLHKDHGLLSAMDIVLNHCAGTAPWLLEHPESAYSVGNSPHLTAAAELDERLQWYSAELRDGRLGGPRIDSPADLDRVVDGVRQHVMEALKLHEYFMLDQGACVAAFKSEAAVRSEREDFEALKADALPSIGAKRQGVLVSGRALRRCCRDEGAVLDCLKRLQDDLWSEWSGVESDIYKSVRGVITWERLDSGGPRHGPVGDGHLALLPCYFRRLKLAPAAAARLGKETEVVAHNGWVMDWPATEDFAAPAWRFVYLRRHLCAWGDCVKLRFGQGPADAPFLWDHMTRYAVSMAQIFHAIRLDNAHSTPLHVSQHILAQCRKANPHVWIFAELFTGNFHTDLMYQRTLGINALIREAMQTDSPGDICQKLSGHLWGAHPLGEIPAVPTLDRLPPPERKDELVRNASSALIGATTVPLRPRHCPALLFDCTHDNETPSQKRHPCDALPNAALVAASCASIGSVRGYDELLPTNPSVVFERRLYQKIEGVSPLALDWAAAAAAAPAAPAPATEGLARLEFVWPGAAAGSVEVRGSWNGWQSPLVLSQGAGQSWAGSLSLSECQLPVQYKFIVDGSWCVDERQPTVEDGSGNRNNIKHGSRPAAGGVAGGELQPIAGPDLRHGGPLGILAAKQVLNLLHAKLGREGFTEIASRRLAEDVVSVQRRAPDSGRATWFVVRSAYSRDGVQDRLPCDMDVLTVPGEIEQLHAAATLSVDRGQRSEANDKFLTGLRGSLCVRGSIQDVANVWREGSNTMVKLHTFPAGSVLVFSTAPGLEAECRSRLDRLLAAEAVERPLKELSLAELNYLLFSCEAEELDRSDGQRGAYNVDGHGPFMYCGLMGVCAALDECRRSMTDVLGSPVLGNVRDGDWLLDYLTARLDDMPALAGVRDWMIQAKVLVSSFPRHLVPFCFDLVVTGLCSAACRVLLGGSGGFVATADGPLVRDLALATAQFWAATKSAPLHWDRAKAEGWRRLPSLSAGLPHFSSGFMRNWGRDTFIALRGCLLVTQRFAEARETLLVYASVARHGLIPNLLDAANNPRYNARDATWFFLQGVQDYVEASPEGQEFLAAPVRLKYPVESWDKDLQHLEPATVADLVHLILSAHAKGIDFREWRAGPAIDEHMTDKGFDIRVRLDEATGIIYGGNDENCGTWMDKMGSSAKAGNKGVPATPRDGAPVEIVGLLKSTLRWVSGLPTGVFPHAGVKTSSGATLTYKEWDAKLQASFENVFWLDLDEKCPATAKGIYKDTDGATRQWQDYQLRPNFPIAMAVAPELFSPLKAKRALLAVSERLLGPLGVCTLDPGDPEYRGDYHNDDDSCDKSVAHGWNYHQGPEWVWPLGYFLKAWHRFGEGSEEERARDIMRWLLPHRAMLERSPWRSLPELTNSRGAECHHSCPAQAWSLACLLDALHTVSRPTGKEARHRGGAVR
mmetsp:Transcript_36750/g.105083  ORF Transcript_36750/g.105083 Transcript_36750/m.105083 type:complete len:1625 (+) Transcript_36750:66-4940(+)